MFNYMPNNLPVLFDDMFVKNSASNPYVTRQINMFQIPKVRTNLRKMSASFQGVKVWNSVQVHIDHHCSIFSFKKRLKLHILQLQLQP